jgi:hypothetical protein
MLLNHRLADLSLSGLTSAKVASYRDERLRTIKPASINRELNIYRHASRSPGRTGHPDQP